MPDIPLLAAALAHAERGWCVFPLRPGDKRPAVKDWENRATTDPDRITRCWSSGPYGIGIACGPSGLVVIDLDVSKAAGGPDGIQTFRSLVEQRGDAAVWETYTVRTGGGGMHLYYRHPDGPQLRNTASTIGPGIDTRAHGGYVVAAGATVAGKPYTVTVDTDPAPLPGWLAGLLAPARRPTPQPVALPVDRHGRYVAAAIRRQLAYLTAAPKGQRNHTLFASAVALGQLAAGGALTDDDVHAVLEPAALATGLRPGEVARTIASGLRTGARNPRHLRNLGRVA